MAATRLARTAMSRPLTVARAVVRDCPPNRTRARGGTAAAAVPAHSRRCQRADRRLGRPALSTIKGGSHGHVSFDRATACRAQEGAEAASDDVLNEFLAWALGNGVTGIGGPEDLVALYEGEDGERGLLAVQDIQPGDELLRIPLRIALSDHEEDKESNELLYEGAPWSVRLAAKVLRERAAGDDSSWRPYMAVLPASVPSPLNAFAWDNIQEVQYQPARNSIYEADWLAADAYDRADPEAIGNATPEEFRWAMSLVHSRTFGSAAQKGGVGVRMLVPLVDMINHAGDCGGALMPGKEYVCQDVAVWELLPPPQSRSGAWEMIVKAIRPARDGQEITMSYGERENDDFLVHYGFIPDANPHDSVILFPEGVEEGIDWYVQKMESLREFSAEELKSLAKQALHSSKEALGDDGASEPTGNGVAALHGGRVDSRLLAAFQVLAASLPENQAGDASANKVERAAARAVAERCWELLRQMPGSLLEDLASLAALETDPRSNERAIVAMMQQRAQKLEAAHAQAGGIAPCEQGGAGGTSKGETVVSLGSLDPGSTSASEAHLAASKLALKFRAYKKLLLWDLMVQLGPPCCAGMSQ